MSSPLASRPTSLPSKWNEKLPLVAGPVVPVNRITSKSSTTIPSGPPVSPGTVKVNGTEIRIEPSERTWNASMFVPAKPTSEASKKSAHVSVPASYVTMSSAGTLPTPGTTTCEPNDR